MTKAFAAGGHAYTHVLLSVGGNDMFESPNCNLTSAQIQTRVASAIAAVKAAAPSPVQIVMAGYCAPSGATAWRWRPNLPTPVCPNLNEPERTLTNLDEP